MRIRMIICLMTVVVLTACKKDKPSPIGDPNVLHFETGVFITNEGVFPTGSGSISFFDRVTGAVEQNIFEKVNNRPLGNIVQSLEFYNSRGYIIVNNASKVEVVQAGSMKSSGVMDDLNSPRYFLGINYNKGYVSDWANHVAVVDLNTFQIIQTIPTGHGPDKMLKLIDKVFVLNVGGWDVDSTITVIDCITDAVINTIQVAPKPDGIVKDKNGILWLICSGNGWNGYPGPGDSEGHLMAIDPNNYAIIKDFPFPTTDKHPDKLAINNTGDVLYYNHPDGIFSFNISDSSISTLPLTNHSASFYNIGYDVASGYLYASDPVDYNQNGWIYRFNSISGAKVDSFQSGIIPGNFCFY